ncbi:MAG: acyl-CoA dehydrogenase family protein [Burkholderiaceae bacterium]
MSIDSYRPRASLATHEVENQPDALLGVNLYTDDRLLATLAAPGVEAAHRDRLASFGARVGSAEVQQWGEQANAAVPQLRAFDRVGRRIDEVEFHPAYHELMRLSLEAGTSSIAWTAPAGGHLAHSLLLFLLTQADAGHGCPVSMTYAAVPALRHQPDVAARWEPRVTSARYDPRCLPPEQKTGCTLGMAMTEKQGGSDVRANRTTARAGDGGFVLDGHKWFCSAPMSDGFLTLARIDGDESLSCFLAPKWRPDGTRNPIEIQRLKDKMGDRSNASAEIEYRGAWAELVGERGRGIPTIIEMVQHTRLDCVSGAAATMRWSLSQAIWHTRNRSAFGKPLVEQPLMRQVLADMVLEVAAAMTMMVRVSMAFDRAAADPGARALARILAPLAKFWVCKRCPVLVAEAMECLGGIGYVEESPLARAFRQSPLNGIWEGSGNVIALDLQRAVARDTDAVGAALAMFQANLAGEPRARAEHALERLRAGDPGEARWCAEQLAIAFGGAALAELGAEEISADWLASRGSGAHAFGAAPLAAGRCDALIAAGMLADA